MAYGLVAADEKKYKKLKEFTQENPVPFFKAMRLANKNFYKFKIVNEKDPNNIIVETTDLNFPDPDVTYSMIYKMMQMESKRGKKKTSLKKPADILKAFKSMMKKSGMKEIPFKTVKKKMKVVKVKNKWYVKPGWKEEVLAKREKEKAQEMAEKNQQAEWKARSAIDKAKRSGNYKEAIDKLEKLHKDAPDSKLIKDGLAQITKLSAAYDKNISKVKAKVLEIKTGMMGSLSIKVEIKNESKLTVESFQVEYSLYDKGGKLVKKEVHAQIFSPENFPPFKQGVPGYVGKASVALDKMEKPAKAKVKLKNVSFAR